MIILSVIYFFNDFNISYKYIKFPLIALLISILIFFNPYDFNNIKQKNKNSVFLINDLINLHNDNNEILADGGQIFRYYTNLNNIVDLYLLDPHNPEFYVREKYQNINIKNKILNKHYNMIIIQKNRKYSNEQIEYIFNSDY